MDLVPPQIAVVDDDEDTVNLFTEIIQLNGYIVIGFENPQFLIDYICEHEDQLKFILIDYIMPEMSGCTLANKIHELNPSIEMAFITASNENFNNSLNKEIIRKPIPMNKIIELVDKYMHQELSI